MSIDTVAMIATILVGMIAISGFTSRSTNKRIDDKFNETKQLIAEVNRRIDDKTDAINKRVDDKTDAISKRVDDKTDAINRRIDDKSDATHTIIRELSEHVRALTIALLADHQKPDNQKTGYQAASEPKADYHTGTH